MRKLIILIAFIITMSNSIAVEAEEFEIMTMETNALTEPEYVSATWTFEEVMTHGDAWEDYVLSLNESEAFDEIRRVCHEIALHDYEWSVDGEYVEFLSYDEDELYSIASAKYIVEKYDIY